MESTPRTSRSYAQISTYQYLETNFMSKNSEIPFFGLGYEHDFSNRNGIITAKIEGQFGTTHYNGAGSTGPDYMLTYSAQIERIWPTNQHSLIAGLGYRNLYDIWGNQSTSSGLPTYDRQSAYIFGSIGTLLTLDDGYSIEVRYRHLLEGIQKSYFEGFSNPNQLTNVQPRGFGIRIDLELYRDSIIFFDYWQIADSNLDNQGQRFFEPENTTTQIGFRRYF